MPRRGLAATVASAFVSSDWHELFEVVYADEGTILDAMEMVIGHKLAFCDAMLRATARRHGCSTLFSEDMQDRRRLGGLEIVNPFAVDNSDRVSALLRP